MLDATRWDEKTGFPNGKNWRSKLTIRLDLKDLTNWAWVLLLSRGAGQKFSPAIKEIPSLIRDRTNDIRGRLRLQVPGTVQRHSIASFAVLHFLLALLRRETLMRLLSTSRRTSEEHDKAESALDRFT